MKRPHGDIDTAREADDFTEELRIQLILFSEWLELQGFTKEIDPEVGTELTHSDLVVTFMEGVARQ